MAGGLTVSVRQIASYSQAGGSPSDLVLVQEAGLGGPYAARTSYNLAVTALAAGGPIGIGYGPIATAQDSTLFINNVSVVGNGGGFLYNCYFDNQGVLRYWGSGLGAGASFDDNGTFRWDMGPAGIAGQPVIGFSNLMSLSPAGALSLPLGTLTVARDPGAPLEVATMGWVGSHTVVSFNGRMGAVCLLPCDLEAVLGYPLDCIATVPQVNEIVCAAIQDLIRTYPSVWSWNGRVGDVWLNVGDINWALNQPGAPPLLLPAPPADATDSEAVNAEWVINYITQTAGFATEAWVTQQLATAIAGTVASFNGRQGAVTLNLNDIMVAGGAPIAGPSFSGIPTAPTAVAGTSSAQLATCAFVMATLTAISPGVISFNTRSGAVTLALADITSAGGAPVASPNFTGTPAAPTAPQGTSTSQIATTAFVMGEIAATTAGVVSFNGRSGVVTLQLGDITAAGGAPLNNPAFTGQPAAPTAPNGTSSAQLATTAFVMNEINAISAGVTTFNGRSGAVTLTANDVTAVGGLANPSPQLTGTPTAPTPAANDSSTNIATTAFVQAAIANIGGGYLPITGGVSMTGLFNLSGNAAANLNPVPLQQLNSTLLNYATTAAVAAAFAPLASPALTGTPTVPTAAPGTSTTQAASTAFTQAAIASAPYIPQNYVDNSGFTVNQRAYASGTALAAAAYGLDRWKAGAAGATLTFTASPAATVVTISAGSLQQVVEGLNMLGQAYTLSWTGTAQGRIATTSGGGTYAASPVQFTGTANTNTFIEFTGGTLSRVQLQLGTVATAWQPQPFEVELARCQRFFQNTGGFGIASNCGTSAVSVGGSAQLPVPMRAIPTVVITEEIANVNVSTRGANNLTTQSIWFSATAANSYNWILTYSASADL